LGLSDVQHLRGAWDVGELKMCRHFHARRFVVDGWGSGSLINLASVLVIDDEWREGPDRVE